MASGEDAAARAEASLRALEAGGLPLAAQERLRDLRARGGLFTSDLSTNEFLLARQAGLRPLTQVMGSCFYHVGWQAVPYGAAVGQRPSWDPAFGWQGGPGWGQGQTYELETPTEAWNEARRLAFGRLGEEARLAGADAVVGLRLETARYDWAADLIEVVAVGTAVTGGGGTTEAPALSSLSGQELATLAAVGWRPVGLLAATSVCFVATGWKQQRASTWMGSAWQNQELPDFTRGVSEARTQAFARLRRQAGEVGAHGVLGLSLELDAHEVETNGVANLLVTTHAVGTAVVEVAEQGPDVYLAVSLT